MSGPFFDRTTACAEARVRSQSDPAFYWYVVESAGEFMVEHAPDYPPAPSGRHERLEVVYRGGRCAVRPGEEVLK